MNAHTTKRHTPSLARVARWLFVGVLCLSWGCIDQAERVCADDDGCSAEKGAFVCIKKRCVAQICTPDTARPCYDGPETTKAKGTCRQGRQLCIQRGTAWSACYGQSLPRAELCDGQDNDCDGQADEELDCQCQIGETRPCYTGDPMHLTSLNAPTSCRQGVQRCTSQATWGPCAHQRRPHQELRDALEADANSDQVAALLQACLDVDLNCDGQPDALSYCACTAGQTRECHLGPAGTAGVGLCNKGQQSCQDDGTWGPCQGAGVVPPVNEELNGCNGLDDDCDGQIDNQTGTSAPLSRRCGDDSACMIQTCPLGVDKTWGTCEHKELCANQRDDDCDGSVDESDCRKE